MNLRRPVMNCSLTLTPAATNVGWDSVPTRSGQSPNLQTCAHRASMLRPKTPKTLLPTCFMLVLLGVVPSRAESVLRMTDVTAQSGIAFVHSHGGAGQGYIVEGVVGGLALFDYDRDGLIDIYFLNGAPLQGTEVDTLPRNALYRNNGDGSFTDVTARAGVGDLGHGLAVTVGDYNNNGYPDLYISNFGPNVLYRNNGDGTFTEVTQETGVGNGDRVGAGVSFLDIDGDGTLDLFASNYIDFTYENHVPLPMGQFLFQASPQYYRPVPDTLYRNNGDGTFSDVTESSGIGSVVGPGMGVVCFDYNGNGHTDILVCNDGAANFLYHNDGQGRFEEVGLVAGLAYDFLGNRNSSMGVDCGDYDNDGHPDLIMTNFASEMPVLYRNLGEGFFVDATNAARLDVGLFPHVTWGAGFADFDNDGHRDLFIACGHFDPIEHVDDRTAFRVRNFLLRNRGDGTFEDVSRTSGSGLAVVESSRGVGLDDLTNDGRVDVVVLNSNAPPTIIRNDSDHGHHWLQVQLRGVTANRDAVGARVRVVAGDRTQVAEVHSGRGYQSHYGSRLGFGLGKVPQVDRLEVRWPGGGVEVFTDLAVDQIVVLTQGTGQAKE